MSRDIGSKSGSSLKPNPNDPTFPKFGSVQPRILDRNVPHILQDGDVILIGKVHYGFAHELHVTIHHPEDDLEDQDGRSSSEGRKGNRKLSWRRSLHCNGCMGWGRRHSCSARLSQLQKMILDCNRKSNIKAPRPIKTALQKALFHRVSGWWPKKQEKTVTFTIPERYESNPAEVVGGLPDEPALADSESQEVGGNDEAAAAGEELSATVGENDEDWG